MYCVDMASISRLSKAMRDRSISARKDKLLGLASFSAASYLSSSAMEGNCSCELQEEDLWAEPADEQARAMQYDGESIRSSSRCRRSRAGGGRETSSTCADRRLLHRQELSAPVNIPDWSHVLGADRPGVDDDEDDDDDQRVPPHELVARAHAKSQTPTFSVYEGVGRTLKGRDLDRVRSAILRETGFIDHL